MIISPKGFPRFFRQMRQKISKTLGQIGKEVGHSAKWVHDLEAGRVKPNPKLIPQFAKALGVSQEEILKNIAETEAEITEEEKTLQLLLFFTNFKSDAEVTREELEFLLRMNKEIQLTQDLCKELLKQRREA